METQEADQMIQWIESMEKENITKEKIFRVIKEYVVGYSDY